MDGNGKTLRPGAIMESWGLIFSQIGCCTPGYGREPYPTVVDLFFRAKAGIPSRPLCGGSWRQPIFEVDA
jgi:hypothetical protein